MLGTAAASLSRVPRAGRPPGPSLLADPATHIAVAAPARGLDSATWSPAARVRSPLPPVHTACLSLTPFPGHGSPLRGRGLHLLVLLFSDSDLVACRHIPGPPSSAHTRSGGRRSLPSGTKGPRVRVAHTFAPLFNLGHPARRHTQAAVARLHRGTDGPRGCVARPPSSPPADSGHSALQHAIGPPPSHVHASPSHAVGRRCGRRPGP